ncbi:transposase [Candidatus Poribacteria bacterium]|nr:MAG: transposase [Candidatus Poribacteria bacterium]
MLKTHKIALDPNNVQATQFAQHCGYARVAYNHVLADFKRGLNAGKWHSHIELNKRFNSVKHEQYEWCKALNQRAAHNAIYFNFQDAIRRWQSDQSRFPKFKKRSRGQSFQADAGRGTTIVEGHRIKLPKIGWVRMFQSLRYLGTICKVVISKHGHRWFASILVDTFTDAPTPEIRHLPVVGVDVGIKHLAVTSEGVYYENPKVLKRYERKLKRLQRQLSRRKKGSRNWHKTKAKLAKQHYRITCIRQDAQHKATTAIVNRASRIGIESLNVAGMLKNHRLAKALSDASLSSFLSMLRYKAERMGVKIVEADTFYPSSKTCSACGRGDSDLSLSDRTYHCSVCGHTQDRDLNAAINLRTVAMGHTET